MNNKRKNNQKADNLPVLVEQQARQIITLEKKLYDIRDRLNREVEGLKNLERLTEKILSGTLNIEKIANYIIEHLIYEDEVEKGLLFLSLKKGERLKLQSAGGYKKEKIKELNDLDFRIEGLLGEIVKGKGVKIFDTRPKDTRQPLIIKDFMEKFELSYFLAVPLVGQEERIIGLLLAGYSKEKILLISPQFTEEDIILFSALVSQSSLFIENAQINIELQRRVEELERFSKLTIGRELKMVELKKKIKKLKELKNY